jgi:short-subunit dehydrogenase
MRAIQVGVLFFCGVVSSTHAMTLHSKKAIVVGASTGIGREVAKVLSHNGYELGICSRKIDLLNTLKQELSTPVHVRQLDLKDADNIHQTLQELVDEMGGMDLIVVNSGIWPESQQGILPKDKQIPFAWQRETIAVNVTGCTAAFNFAINYFLKQNHGHVVGVSSTDAVRGHALNPSYCASKSFMATFLEGWRNKFIQLGIPIDVTEIRPGWIQTTDDMLLDPDTANYAYWVSSSPAAAQGIYDAIVAKKKVAYVPWRWTIIGLLLNITPDWIYNKMGGF